ncbi:MAG: CheR family methyltransferase [Candidatus Omnitrophota bacterium]
MTIQTYNANLLNRFPQESQNLPFRFSEMDAASYEQFRTIIYEKSGISLGTGKESLVSARIAKRMRTLDLKDYKAYLNHLYYDETGEEIYNLLDVISTNVTSFFRQPDHLDFLSQVFSQWIEEGRSRFRFWSSACATGEEPYSLAMKLLDAADRRRVDIKILATDISTRVIKEGMQGLYEKEKLKPVPGYYIPQYFQALHGEGKSFYEIKPFVKEYILFRRLNLSAPPFPMRGPFDAVLCCNVLIYFDDAVRKRLLENIHRLLKPDGYLFIGYSESIKLLANNFRMIKPSIYIKE